MSKGISIHVGMEYVSSEHYGEMVNLETCPKDAMDMQEIAVSQNFETTLLLNEDGTREAIKEAITSASKRLEKGDMLFFSYSGHGGTLPDKNGDEGPNDHADETLCLYDGQLLDDELLKLWTLFDEGVRIFVVSDSCHSGTVIKAPPSEDVEESSVTFKTKSISSQKAVEVYKKNRAFYDLIGAESEVIDSDDIKATVKLIAGCQDYESSYVLNFADNSLFTEKLNEVWDAGQFVGTTPEFFEQIRERVASIELKDASGDVLTQTPNLLTIGKDNEEFDNQRPFGIYEYGLS